MYVGVGVAVFEVLVLFDGWCQEWCCGISFIVVNGKGSAGAGS